MWVGFVHSYFQYRQRELHSASKEVPQGVTHLTHGTAVGWGADYKQLEMIAIADTSADLAAHSARATPARAAAAPRGRGLLGLRWVAPACCTSGPPGRVLRGTCRSHS